MNKKGIVRRRVKLTLKSVDTYKIKPNDNLGLYDLQGTELHESDWPSIVVRKLTLNFRFGLLSNN